MSGRPRWCVTTPLSTASNTQSHKPQRYKGRFKNRNNIKYPLNQRCYFAIGWFAGNILTLGSKREAGKQMSLRRVGTASGGTRCLEETVSASYRAGGQVERVLAERRHLELALLRG